MGTGERLCWESVGDESEETRLPGGLSKEPRDPELSVCPLFCHCRTADLKSSPSCWDRGLVGEESDALLVSDK